MVSPLFYSPRLTQTHPQTHPDSPTNSPRLTQTHPQTHPDSPTDSLAKMNPILHTLLYIWQLPQNLLGLLFLAYTKISKRFECKMMTTFTKGQKVYCIYNYNTGVSLGEYIFLGSMPKMKDIRHEYGHCRQSRMLGPLYLIVIGLPSLLHCIFFQHDYSRPNAYYEFYTEKWADKLGGVQR